MKYGHEKENLFKCNNNGERTAVLLPGITTRNLNVGVCESKRSVTL